MAIVTKDLETRLLLSEEEVEKGTMLKAKTVVTLRLNRELF